MTETWIMRIVIEFTVLQKEHLQDFINERKVTNMIRKGVNIIKRDCSIICNLLSGLSKVNVIAGVILAVITLTACSQVNSMGVEISEVAEESNDTESSKNSENNKIEISMEDAISMGREEAVKYYNDLQLTEIHSYDNDQSLDNSAGDDGKRQWWYVNFANENKNYVSILISDGEIDVVEHFDDNANTGLLDLSEINLTAEEAVKKAQKMGLAGGNPDNGIDWVSGYNFKMSYASLTESPDDIRIFLEVIGISPNGNLLM